MKLFISWSGNSSNTIARVLTTWLPKIFLNKVEPWISIDIERGAQSLVELTNGLAQSQFGILCITPNNLDSAWMLFEAGAISMAKKLNNKPYVCPYLFNVRSSDLPEPLAQFQTARTDEEGTYGLVQTINSFLENPLSEMMLREVFDENWSSLDEDLKKIPVQRRCIRVGYGKIVDLLSLLRDSVLCNIFHNVLEDTLRLIRDGRYNFDDYSLRVEHEIRVSRELYRGFCTKNTGIDLCEFLEEHFTRDELREKLREVEHILLTEEDIETKRDRAFSYTQVIGGEIFSRLIRKLYDLEHSSL